MNLTKKQREEIEDDWVYYSEIYMTSSSSGIPLCVFFLKHHIELEELFCTFWKEVKDKNILFVWQFLDVDSLQSLDKDYRKYTIRAMFLIMFLDSLEGE